MIIFWDTNVLVDLLMVRRPFYDPASTILSMSEENGWQIIVSSLSIIKDFQLSSIPVLEPDDFILLNQ